MRRLQRRLRHLSAFTIIELLVVITIIGILLTLVTVAIKPVQMKSRDSKRKADISLMRSGLDLFKSDFKIYPNFTFYLGNNASESSPDTGATNSSFSVAAQLNSCSALPSGRGALADFASNTTDLNSATLRQGFSSVNSFLICMKYMEQSLTDPTATNAVDGYQFRVGFDYSDMVISAKLENSSDQSNQIMFNVSGASPRFIAGNGLTDRALADDSDTNAFYSSLSGTVSDGYYLYQCLLDASSGNPIKKDDTSSANYQPIVANGQNWTSNPACQNSAAGVGLSIAQAFGTR